MGLLSRFSKHPDIERLAAIGDYDRLILALKSKTETIRRRAEGVLMQMLERIPLALIITSSSDKNPHVRTWAAKARSQIMDWARK